MVWEQLLTLYLGRVGWRNFESEETEGKRKSQKPSSGFQQLNTIWFGFQTWQFSNRKCQLIRAIAWHHMMIAVIPAGWGPAIALGGEMAWYDMNVSVSFLRRDSLVGWLTWQAVNRINLIALAVVGGCMKETFWLCCQHLIPNDYHIPLNWCWTKYAWGLATTLPKIVSAIWSWQTRVFKRKQAFQLKPVRTSPC